MKEVRKKRPPNEDEDKMLRRAIAMSVVEEQQWSINKTNVNKDSWAVKIWKHIIVYSDFWIRFIIVLGLYCYFENKVELKLKFR